MGHGATKLSAPMEVPMPMERAVSSRKCLFEELSGSEYFWGSEGSRSPLHYLRNPGEPEYNGATPTF